MSQFIALGQLLERCIVVYLYVSTRQTLSLWLYSHKHTECLDDRRDDSVRFLDGFDLLYVILGKEMIALLE